MILPTMYLVVLAVLSIVLTFPEPPFPWLRDPVWTALAVGVATALPCVAAAAVNRAALARFEAYPEQPGRGQHAFQRGMLIVQVLLAVGHAAVLLCTDWLNLTEQIVRVWLLLPGLLALAPFVLSMVLIWLALYPADRAVRQMAIEIYLFRGKPLRRVWTRGEYLLFNLRHQVLFILVPMLFILAARDVVVRYDDAIRTATGLDYAGDVLLGSAAVLVALLAPEMLRHVWVTQRLPEGPLRDRLLLLCEHLHMRCREILVWRSGGMIVNAAVMGVVAPLRYVLITDAMLEQLEDAKIEAVFGHEAGHVKRHHILFFLLFALISGSLVMIFSVHVRGATAAQYQVASAVMGAILLAKWGLGFGWISRRFERQADVFGVRTLAIAGVPCSLPCLVHNPPKGQAPAARGEALCTTAAQVFGLALNEVALLNGIRPEAHSWRHSSIASRSRFVQRLAREPRRLRQFERTVLLVKVLIFALAIAGSAWAAYEIELWDFALRLLGRVS